MSKRALTAEKARKGTVIDMKLADAIENNIDTRIEKAMRDGMTHVEAWGYDYGTHRWLGDVPDAVIDELERRFEERGFELSTIGKCNCLFTVINW